MSDLTINTRLRPGVKSVSDRYLEMQTAAAVHTEGEADFLARAGVHHHKAQTQSVGLQRRLQAAPKQKRSQTANKSGSQAGGVHQDPLSNAITEITSILGSEGLPSLEKMLDANYDVLERHTLLRSALDEAEGDHHDQLEQLLTKLESEHGPEIAVGRQQADSFDTMLEVLNTLSAASRAEHDPESLHGLRAMYSDKSSGNSGGPVTAKGLVETLQKKFGSDNFASALAQLRSDMVGKDDLRTRRKEDLGPRLWLSLSDAASFNLVQSTFAIGCEMRGKLSEKVGIVPVANETDTAMALLSVGEPGANKAKKLLSELVKPRDLDSPSRLQQAGNVVAEAVQTMPTTLWPTEKLAQRAVLLDDLRTMAHGMGGRSALPNSPEAILERALREKLHRKKMQGPRLGRSDRYNFEYEDDDDDKEQAAASKNGRQTQKGGSSSGKPSGGR